MTQGTIEANLYTGSYVDAVHGAAAEGEVSVLLTPGLDRVVSFSADYEYTGLGYTLSEGLGGQDVPYVETTGDPPIARYEVEGAAVCGSVETARSLWSQTDGWYSGFSTFSCGEDSYVEIHLYDPDKGIPGRWSPPALCPGRPGRSFAGGE